MVLSSECLSRANSLGIMPSGSKAITYLDYSVQTTALTLVLPILTPFHVSWPLPPMLPRPLSSPHQPVEQRPRQHKTHTAIQYISGPQLAPGSLEIVPLSTLCQYAPDEYGDEEGAEKVEEETGVGLEAEDSGGDAEEGGGQGADVGDYLRGQVSDWRVLDVGCQKTCMKLIYLGVVLDRFRYYRRDC